MTCALDNDQRGAPINAFLAAGRAPNWIEAEMRRMGSVVKAETIRKHVRNCLAGDPQRAGFVLQDALDGNKVSDNGDFALAIRNEANRLLADGTLKVTAQHGLQAQALLDRRAERAADRNLLLQMAGLLSGTIDPSGPPPDLIVGEWREVEESEPFAPLALPE